MIFKKVVRYSEIFSDIQKSLFFFRNICTIYEHLLINHNFFFKICNWFNNLLKKRYFFCNICYRSAKVMKHCHFFCKIWNSIFTQKSLFFQLDMHHIWTFTHQLSFFFLKYATDSTIYWKTFFFLQDMQLIWKNNEKLSFFLQDLKLNLLFLLKNRYFFSKICSIYERVLIKVVPKLVTSATC